MVVGAAREVGSGEAIAAVARVRRLVIVAWTLLLAVAWGALSVHPDYGSDAFFHWMLGREILRTHASVVPERWALPGFHATCTVPYRLWDVGAWLVQSRFGAAGVAVVVVVMGGAAAWACARLVALHVREAATFILVSTCISPLVLARIQQRPESAAMVLVPCLLILAEKLGAATSTRERTIRAAEIVALVLLWVQIHPSFLIAPILVAIVAGDRLVGAEPRVAVGLVVALGLVSLTSVHGLGVFRYAWTHTSSYGVAHITEWSSPTWDMLDPTRNVHLPLYAGLWLAALVGVGRARTFPPRAFALALFGLVLGVQARRNLGLGAELLVPFAVAGVDGLLAGASLRIERAAIVASMLFAMAVFARLAAILDLELGPLGTVAAPDALFPVHAAAFLAHAPEGARVMTTYDAGAPLAFWLDGHVRISIDSRTPLYFDDPEFAAARASWEDAGALDKTLRMYSFDAAVLDRSSPVCALLAARGDWKPVVVEATYTTFVRADAYHGGSAGHLSPCGDDRFTTDVCDDGGAATLRELDALAGDPFLAAMRVEARIRCGRDATDADALAAMLPPRGRAAGFLAERDGLLAWILAHAGQLDEAVDLVSPYVADGDVRAASRIAWVLDERGDRRLRPMLQQLVAAHDEAAPPWVFALLADACAREGRLECAATYGIFAAAKGEGEASPALCAVSTKHPDPVTRAEATRWLEALRADAKPGASGAVVPACP